MDRASSATPATRNDLQEQRLVPPERPGPLLGAPHQDRADTSMPPLRMNDACHANAVDGFLEALAQQGIAHQAAIDLGHKQVLGRRDAGLCQAMAKRGWRDGKASIVHTVSLFDQLGQCWQVRWLEVTDG
jgi:hypothetical protein